jgi:fibronectin type III domain protein
MKTTWHLQRTIIPWVRGSIRCPPLGRVFLFVAHLLACVALAPVAQALCHPPNAWATDVASYSFTANWSSVMGATSYHLDVSTSSSFTTYVPGYQDLNVGNVTSRSVTGLNQSTTYYFRVRAYRNLQPCPYSQTVQVTTLSPTGPPVVITKPATYIASYSATLNGTVDPHGLTTTVYFQYGTTISYGLTTAIQSKTGDTYQDVVANISGLTASTTYHFRIVATNSAGTTYGADRTFTTLGPTVPTWHISALGDFNHDGKPDYGLYNVSTRRTAVWYMNNNVFVTGAYGPTLPAGWQVIDVADFNGDGNLDYALFNPSTRQSAI